MGNLEKAEMRRFIFILITTISFLNSPVLGQGGEFKILSDTEQKIFDDLSSTFNDSSITFVISPLVLHSIDTSSIDLMALKKMGFDKNQFSVKSKDTLLIRNNEYFKIIDPDSLIKYQNIEFSAEYRIKAGIDLFQSPILYFVEKNYKKEGICYFYKPIFSKNKTSAIIEYWISCGSLCGWGEIVLMRKEKEKWTRIETLAFNES